MISNSSDFNNFATLATDGVNDSVSMLFDLLPAGNFANQTTEHVMFPDFTPDLVGARIAFVRLVVDSLDSGVFPSLHQSGQLPPRHLPRDAAPGHEVASPDLLTL